MAKNRHKWEATNSHMRQVCQKCGCQRTGYNTRPDGSFKRQWVSSYVMVSGYRSWNKAPECVPDTPLLVAVRAYIRKELSREI